MLAQIIFQVLGQMLSNLTYQPIKIKQPLLSLVACSRIWDTVNRFLFSIALCECLMLTGYPYKSYTEKSLLELLVEEGNVMISACFKETFLK